MKEDAMVATGFASQRAYQSPQRPGYTSWVTLFPGEHGQWYLGFLEVTRVDPPLPPADRQRWYEMSLPVGYDMSPYRREAVLLTSDSTMASWTEVWRQPCRFHEGAGTFAQARTQDGRFLWFRWSCYSDDPELAPNQILYESQDQGRSWVRQPPFHHPRFASYPHRLRALADGTLVLCLPLAPRWGQGTEYPVRAATRLDVVNDMQMTLCFSHDQGRTWSPPLPVLAGQNVSETDFVELADGDLLLLNNSIFACPGRQRLYREGQRFTPGPLEKVHSGTVPETVCRIDDEVLVGCMRPGAYYASDDLGLNWQPLTGLPTTMEVYQPWMHHLGNGRVVCAGHYGADDPMGGRDQFISIHSFAVELRRRSRRPRLWIERDFDANQRRYLNRYRICLSLAGQPLAAEEVQAWYVEREHPGYDAFGRTPLPERMAAGGTEVRLRTDPDGVAVLDLSHLDDLRHRTLPYEPIHHSYQLIVRFNVDRDNPAYLPAQLPQLEFYVDGSLQPDAAAAADRA